MLLVKQRLARLVPGWVTHGPCSGADVGLARFTTVRKQGWSFIVSMFFFFLFFIFDRILLASNFLVCVTFVKR